MLSKCELNITIGIYNRCLDWSILICYLVVLIDRSCYVNCNGSGMITRVSIKPITTNSNIVI